MVVLVQFSGPEPGAELVLHLVSKSYNDKIIVTIVNTTTTTTTTTTTIINDNDYMQYLYYTVT